MENIPVNQPLLQGNEKAYLEECIDSGWISSEGPYVQRLEEGMTSVTGRKYGIAVCNGSMALDAAVSALRLGPGDEIILPTFTIISCIAAVLRAGAIPVLVDCDPDTWCMNTEQVAKKITPATRAIMVVHIYGLPVDMSPITKLAEQHGLRIIEDAAEAHGLSCNNKPCGSFGTISTFSFYTNKHVTTGEGGMLLTDDPKLADRCRKLRNLFFDPKRRFVHEELGWNLRMSNLQAAVGVAQLETLDQTIQRKREIGGLYTEALRDIPHIQLPRERTPYADNIYWVYGVVLGDEIDMQATEMMAELAQRGIGTRPFFWPLHEQPVFLKKGMFKDERYPVAERVARRGFYLPSGAGLTDAQLKRVVDAVREILL